METFPGLTGQNARSSLAALSSRRNLLLNARGMGGRLQLAPKSTAGRARAIDLKLRLALRVAALAAVCFLAVAAYALFDSNRVARTKAGRIAEIVAKDIALQQAEARWFSLSSDRTPDLQRVAAPLMEPGLC